MHWTWNITYMSGRMQVDRCWYVDELQTCISIPCNLSKCPDNACRLYTTATETHALNILHMSIVIQTRRSICRARLLRHHIYCCKATTSHSSHTVVPKYALHHQRVYQFHAHHIEVSKHANCACHSISACSTSGS